MAVNKQMKATMIGHAWSADIVATVCADASAYICAALHSRAMPAAAFFRALSYHGEGHAIGDGVRAKSGWAMAAKLGVVPQPITAPVNVPRGNNDDVTRVTNYMPCVSSTLPQNSCRIRCFSTLE